MIVGIVGLGLIGASYASGLKAAGHTVYGHDRSSDVMERAVSNKVIDGPLMDRMPECDVIILALLPEANAEFVACHASEFTSGQVLSDVAGVKSSMMASIEAVLPEGVTYVSHHPMAGNPEGGYDNHNPRLFTGANAILVESPLSDAPSFEAIEALIEALGMTKSMTMDAATHDRFIAHTSQLTHLISSALVLSGKEDIPLEAGGNSYHDLTRIGDIEPDLWTPLFLDNKEALLDTLATFRDTLETYRQVLAKHDEEALRALLENTRQAWRRQNR